MEALEMLWRAHPLEVIGNGAVVVLCGLGIVVCLIGLLRTGSEDIDYADDFD